MAAWRKERQRRGCGRADRGEGIAHPLHKKTKEAEWSGQGVLQEMVQLLGQPGGWCWWHGGNSMIQQRGHLDSDFLTNGMTRAEEEADGAEWQDEDGRKWDIVESSRGESVFAANSEIASDGTNEQVRVTPSGRVTSSHLARPSGWDSCYYSLDRLHEQTASYGSNSLS